MNPLLVSREHKLMIAGHRGTCANAPENTLASFRLARERGGEGAICETDVQLTKDEELVLIHDDTVDRTTNGKGLVSEMTAAELEKLDAGSWFGEQFAGERIPLLRDALVLARKIGVTYQMELKTYDRNELLFAKLKAMIDDLGAADLLHFSSFDFAQLRDVKKVIPEVPTVGHLHSRMIHPEQIAQEANVDMMSLEIDHFPQGEALQCHAAGVAVALYIGHPRKLVPCKEYGRDIPAMAEQWVREGQCDQIVCDDLKVVAGIRRKVFGY